MSGRSDVPGRARGGSWTLAAGAFLIAGTLATGCAKQQAAAPPKESVPVVVSKVVQKVMPVQLTAIGNVEAYSTVAIRAQVAGELLEVHFQEGDFVHKDQVLLTIDPRPYQSALAQAQAQLARDKAVAANNRSQAERYQQLLDAGIAARDQVDTLRSGAEASESVVNADEAAIKTAELNLEYCTIRSPIDGRTGALMVKAGNLVKVADVPIVVINQVSPIYVNFTVPQEYLPDVKKYMAQGSLRVLAAVPNNTGAPEEGHLTFVDNAVDPSTGTIHLKAAFENTRNILWPGLYVSTTLTLSQQANAVVIPAQGINAGQKGPFVYVLKADNTVESRSVLSPRTVAGEAVIDQGLRPGETIVVDGQARLVPGAKVEVTNASDPADATPARAPNASRAGSGDRAAPRTKP